MQEAVLKNLKTLGLIKKHTTNRLIVAYSGGVDSTVLLHILSELRNELDLELYAAYVHHNWRPLPIKELPLLHKTCQSWNIPLVLIESDRTASKTENEGRSHRYNQLTALANDLNATAVLTAHHADDQVETILFRILRGTGADGLVGIHNKLAYTNENDQTMIVARPMIDIAQGAIEEYAKNNQIQYFDDPSNENTKFHRNLIRNEIIPGLETHFPQLKNSLFKLGLVLEGDLEIIRENIDQLWPEVAKTDKEGHYLDMTAFSRYNLPQRRRLLRRFLQVNQVEISFQAIEEILEFIGGEFRQNLSTGLKSLDKDSDGLERFISLYNHQLRIITPKQYETGKKPTTHIPVNQAIHVPDYKISVEIEPLTKRPSWTTDVAQPENDDVETFATIIKRPDYSYEVYLDHLIFDEDDMLKPEAIQLRTRKNGDRFHQKGMDSPMRLKKYFINKRIPRFSRDHIPLLAFENKVLWIEDHGLSEEVQPTEMYPATHRLKIKFTDSPIIDESEEEVEEAVKKVPVGILAGSPLDESEFEDIDDIDSDVDLEVDSEGADNLDDGNDEGVDDLEEPDAISAELAEDILENMQKYDDDSETFESMDDIDNEDSEDELDEEFGEEE